MAPSPDARQAHQPAPRMAGLHQVAVGAFLLCVLAGAWAGLWLLLVGAAPTAVDWLICAAPALMALGMSFTSTVDRHQYVARLVACCVMLPVLLIFWASSQDPAPGTAPAWPAAVWLHKSWLYFTVWAVVQVLAFLLALWWLAAAATQVEPDTRTAKLSAALLSQHLQALCASSLPVDLTPGSGAAHNPRGRKPRVERIAGSLDSTNRSSASRVA